jgi:sensor histidine kinase YesM
MNFLSIKNINYLNLWKLAFLLSLGYIIYYSATGSFREKAKEYLKSWELEKIKKNFKNDSKVEPSRSYGDDAKIGFEKGKNSAKKYNVKKDTSEAYKVGTALGKGVKKYSKPNLTYNKIDRNPTFYRSGYTFTFAILNTFGNNDLKFRWFWWAWLIFIITTNYFIIKYLIKKHLSERFEIGHLITYFVLIFLICTFYYWVIVLLLGDLRFQFSISLFVFLILFLITSIQIAFLIIIQKFYPSDPKPIDSFFDPLPKYINLVKINFLNSFIQKIKSNTFIQKWETELTILLVVIAINFFDLFTSTLHEATFLFNLLMFTIALCFFMIFGFVFGSIHYKFIHKIVLSNKKGFSNYLLYFILNFFYFLLLTRIFGLIFKNSEAIKDLDNLAAFTFALALIYSLFTDYKHNRTIQEKLEQQRNRAELSTLKAQINPHFLFNTLNNLYGTAIVEEADKTAAGIHQLAGIMRHVVEESKHESTPIEKEIKFLGDFIELNKIRLPNRENIKVIVNVKYDEKSFLIAPLLLIPFVENAFKYGISIKDECFVAIDLNIVEDKIHFICRNSIIKNNNLEPSTGTGIDNVRKRLALNYPNKHKLDISDESGVFVVDLVLDLS